VSRPASRASLPAATQGREVNPFEPGRFQVAFSLLPAAALDGRLLDYGCGDGTFIGTMAGVVRGQTYACDISEEAVTDCRARDGAGTEFFTVPAEGDARLPFPDGFFSAVTMCDVLEHLGSRSESGVVREAGRVLEPGGSLVITVPHRGIQAWADRENIKFRWPRLHRRLYEWLHGHEEYERRYGRHADRFGNFTPGAAWHRHYSLDEIRRLVEEGGLRVDASVYFSVFFPFIYLGLSLLERVERRYRLNLRPLIRLFWSAWHLDARLNLGRLSYNLAVRAVKPENAP
jgi:SAM-dependent methyltransferase